MFQSLRCARGNGRFKEAYTLVLFVLMLIPVIVEPINKIWHTGSYQAFPGRYGYILVLLGLCLAAQVLQRPVDPPLQAILRPMDSGAVYSAGRCDFSPLFPFGAVPPKPLLFIPGPFGERPVSSDLFDLFPVDGGMLRAGPVLYRHRMLSRRLLAICLCVLTATEALFTGHAFCVEIR